MGAWLSGSAGICAILWLVWLELVLGALGIGDTVFVEKPKEFVVVLAQNLKLCGVLSRCFYEVVYGWVYVVNVCIGVTL